MFLVVLVCLQLSVNITQKVMNDVMTCDDILWRGLGR